MTNQPGHPKQPNRNLPVPASTYTQRAPKPIFVARPIDDNNIIDAEPHTYTTHPFPNQSIQEPLYTPREPLHQTPPPHFGQPPPNDMGAPPKYKERSRSEEGHNSYRLPFRPWAIFITPVEHNWFKVTIYGTRGMLFLLLMAIMLIGFSLEKVPQLIPQVIDFIP